MKRFLAKLIHTVGGAVYRRSNRQEPTPAGTRRILVLLFHYMGDTFFATPALAALKRQFPSATLDVALNSRNRDVLLNNPDIQNTFIFDSLCNDRTREARTDRAALRQFARQLQGYDLLVDFTCVPASCALAAWADPRWSVGFSKAGLGFVFDQEIWPTPNLHLVERYNAIAALAGATPTGAQPAIYLGDETTPPAVEILIHCGAGHHLKQWPVDRFRAVAEHFRSAGRTVTIVGGPGDPAEVTNLSIRQVAVWARQSRVYVGLDSGLTHIVASLGIPTVAIFGPSNPDYLPQWPLERVLRLKLACSAAENEQQCAAVARLACSHHNCLQQLDVERVIREITECLAASSISSRS